MSNVYEVVVRHSPCPVKRVQVEAGSRLEALAKFVALNKATAQEPRYTKSNPKLVSEIERWEREGGPDDVSVTLVGGQDDNPPEVVAEVKQEAKRPARRNGLRKLDSVAPRRNADSVVAVEADPTQEMSE